MANCAMMFFIFSYQVRIVCAIPMSAGKCIAAQTVDVAHVVQPFRSMVQVHEKSILIPLLPVTLLAPELPQLARWLPAAAAFSMFPLLQRDGLAVPYAAALLLWVAFAGWQPRDAQVAQARSCGRSGSDSEKAERRWDDRRFVVRLAAWMHERMPAVVLVLGAAVHAFALLTHPPARYPFIHDAAFTCCSFLFFVEAMVELAVHTHRLE